MDLSARDPWAFALDGMGRVGRAYLRQSVETDGLEVVAINDIADASTAGSAPARALKSTSMPVLPR